ncbi:hypothetical protein EV193_11666 [Herbihabitans rhizosphaerae]|uniref:Tetratricopeptide repeat protein n=1 Tax=Herbihabitans rhizosphaerae TaxID=1872711 RepID=A0A4Q7KD09_9PSEU|nr:hypothetical protein [Herbihabitans rhizosphaerae]RZS30545.1 hypothetical protein EV193_11666 [Herbihabitans rhizosphaerae]
MNPRTAAILVTAALVVYFVLLGGRAVALLRDGGTTAVLLGVAVLLLPLLGVWIVVATWRFGIRTDALARKLDAEGGLPDTSDLPRRPSGRVERDAADVWFDERKAELDADPENWRNWFRVAQAYDLAGDRRRAREAMRRAHDLAE